MAIFIQKLLSFCTEKMQIFRVTAVIMMRKKVEVQVVVLNRKSYILIEKC